MGKRGRFTFSIRFPRMPKAGTRVTRQPRHKVELMALTRTAAGTGHANGLLAFDQFVT